MILKATIQMDGRFFIVSHNPFNTTNRPCGGGKDTNGSYAKAKYIDVQSRWCGGTHNFTLATSAKISSALGESIITI